MQYSIVVDAIQFCTLINFLKMSRDYIFKSAVKDLLPNAIPVELDRVDEFAIGKVLVYKKKPTKLIPMRQHKLEFTEWSLDSLLAENQQLNITTSKKYLYDSGKGSSSTTIKVNVEADLDLSKISSLAGGSIDIKGSENKVLKMSTDFGKITHIYSDLAKLMIKENVVVKMDHPLVKKARECGGAMFVIHTVYEAEHCNVSIQVSEDKTESGSESANMIAKESVSEKVEEKHSSSKVVNRDQPTAVAYLVMKVEVDSKGRLSTKLETSMFSRLRVGTNYTDSDKPDPYKGWVIVEQETVTVTANKADPSPGIQADSSSGPEAEASPRPVEEVVCGVALSADTYSAPPPAPAPVAIQGVDEPDLDEHYLYSLKDFQPFQSKTYHGVVDEIKEWVLPLRSNAKLREALTTYLKPPQTYERLNQLSGYFFELGNALRSDKPLPPNKLPNIEPIMSALSKEKGCRLDEISSVIVVAEAGDDFPQHTVQKIVGLEKDKRGLLKELILETPYEADIHGYADAGPYRDPTLKPILSRMGFKIQTGSSNLQYNRRLVEDEEDLLTAVLILLMASE